jgi:hypothetical protein
LKVRARPAARPGGRGGALDADVGLRRHLLVPAPPPDFIGTFAAGSNPVFEASAAAIARVNNVLDAVMVPPVGIFARANCCPSHFTDSFVRYPSLDSRLEMLFGGVKVSPQIVARHLSSTTSGILHEKDDFFIPRIARWFNAVSKISRQVRRTSSLLDRSGMRNTKLKRQVCARCRAMTAIMVLF